jgi:hypothetical protein
VHFIPTSSGLLDLVERWLADLIGEAAGRDRFASDPDLSSLPSRDIARHEITSPNL